MKKFLSFSILILTLLLVFTGCPPTQKPEVNVLNVLQGKVVEPGEVELKWEVIDPSGNNWKVTVFFGDDENNLEKIVDQEKLSSKIVTLEPATTYYWKIVVTGTNNRTTETDIMSFSTCDPNEVPEIYLVKYNSGPPAAGVEAKVFDSETNELIDTFITDEYGRVALLIDDNPEYVDIEFKADGYALSKVIGLNWETISKNDLECVIKKAELNPDPNSQSFPEVEVDFFELDDTILDIDNKISEDFKVHVKVTAENHINIIYAALGNVPSASFFGPRGYATSNTLNYTVDITGYDDITEFHVVAYDYNDNRVHRVFYLDIEAPSIGEVDKFVPGIWSEITGDTNIDSYTRAQGLSFYSDNSEIKNKQEERISSLKKVTENISLDFEPHAAPDDCNLWIDVWWIPWTLLEMGDTPDGYRIYRSFNDEDYELAGTVKGHDKLKFRDKSAKLEPNKRVWYKVASIYGDDESEPADLGSVVPLDSFNIEFISPANGEIGTSRNPVFKWSPTKDVSTDDGTASYIYSSFWLLDLVQSNNQIAPVEFIEDELYLYSWETEGSQTVSVKFLGNKQDPETGMLWYRASPDWYGNTLYPDQMLEKNKVYNWCLEFAFAEVVTDVSAAMSFAIDHGGQSNPIPVESDIWSRFTTGLYGDEHDTTEVPELDYSMVFGGIDNREYFENELIIGYEDEAIVDYIIKMLDADLKIDIPELKAISIYIPMSVKEAYGIIRESEIEGIRYVEPNYIDHLIEPEITNDLNIVSLSNDEDPLRKHQWALDMIEANDAWEYATGKGIIVAVIDTGVDGTHPDLAGQLVTGYDTRNDEILLPNENSDTVGHGTHVAGIIAAIKGNNEGIVGLAHEAKIMPIRIFDPDFTGRDKAAQGIVWAVNNGADVLNNSWGGGGYSHILSDAFNYALINGTIVVVSAGNDHWESDFDYPSGYTGVISVAANNARDEIADFSSRGQRNSVAAPGVNILSTYNVPAIEGRKYVYMQGTSMAGPYVSALSALLREKYPYANPYQIQKMIELSAVDIGEPGWDPAAGYGRINAYEALLQSPEDIDSGTILINVLNRDNSWELPAVYVSLTRDSGRDYYGKTNQFGQVIFNNVDTDTYDVIIGGPEYLDVLAPNFRMQEELGLSLKDIYISGFNNLSINLQSTFSIDLVGDNENADYLFILYNVDTEEAEEMIPFTGELSYTHPKSANSGAYLIIVQIVEGATDIIEGNININGYDIFVEGEFEEGQVIIYDGFVPFWTIF